MYGRKRARARLSLFERLEDRTLLSVMGNPAFDPSGLAGGEAPDIQAPSVLAVAPEGSLSTDVSSLLVTFDEPIDPSTFMSGDVTLTTPSGTLDPLSIRVVPVAELTQWASQVLGFSSEYSPTDWSAAQTLGAPDTPDYGDRWTAWTPSSPDGTQEYLTLGYDQPAYATGVTVRETNCNGFVTSIELIDTSDVSHVIWSGADPSLPGDPVDFHVAFPATLYQVKAVRVNVDTDHSVGWEEIDAVALDGSVESSEPSATFALQVPTQFADGAYAVTIGPDILDLAGNPMAEAFDSAFTIEANPPAIMSIAPEGPIGTDVSSIHVIFSEPIDPSTFTADDVTLTTPSGTLDPLSIRVVPVAGQTQWASQVLDFSSEYSSGDWSAAQALGAPDTFGYGDISTAWAPLLADGTQEFLTLGYDQPFYATGVTIRETFGNGFVTSIELIDTSDVSHVIWAGVDPSLPGGPVDFHVTFPITDYLVKAVRVNVDTDHSAGWEEIDAVALVGSTDPAWPITTFDIQFPTLTDEGAYALTIGPDILDRTGNPMSAAFDSAFTIDKNSPEVIDVTPAVLTETSLDHVDITFSEPMAPATLCPEFFYLYGPYADLTVTSVVPLSPTQVRVFFTQQTDLSSDFSSFDNGRTWSYGWTSSVGGDLNLYADHYQTDGLNGWYFDADGSNPRVLCNSTHNTIWTSDGVRYLPGQAGMQPGADGEDAVSRFTADSNDWYNVSAVFTALESGGTDVHVLVNGVSVFDAAVGDIGLDASYLSPSPLFLHVGDTVDFVVGFGEDASADGDSTGVQATISLAGMRTNGTYWIEIEEGLRDLAGNPMDGYEAEVELSLPDLQVMEDWQSFMALPGGTLALDWSVANCGLSSVGGKITDKIYLASDENPEGLRLLLSVPSAVSDLDVDQSQAFSATVTLPSDLEEGTWYLIVRTDVDGQVLESDYDNNASTVGFVDVRLSLPATVVGRWVFYNDSALDGHTPGAADADDNAIATDKQCLRYDETPSSINRTGSSRGINGVMIDIAGLPAGNSLSSDDFDFYRNDPGAGWVEGPVPSIVSVRRGAGVDGSDRVTLIWDPGQAVVDGWLGVAVLYTEATGLEEEDDFAFGNLRGDVNADGIVDQADYTLWYNSYGSMGGSGDVNFDGIVDQADYTLWYNSYGSTLADPYQPSGETATPTATVTAGGTASAQVAAAQGGNKTVDSSGPADVLALASTTTNPPTCGTTNRVPNRATPVPAAFERASATAEVLTRHRIRATMPSGGPPALEVDLLGPAAAPSLQLLP